MSQETVSLKLLGQHYQFKCRSADADKLKKAGELLNQRMTDIRSSGHHEQQKIAILAALNLTAELELVKLENSATLNTFNRRISGLHQRIKQALTTD